MKRFKLTVAAAVFAVPFAADAQDVSMDDVPQTVKDAAISAAGDVTLDTVGIEEEDGTSTYELSGKDDAGMMLEIDVLEDGTVVEKEQQIAAEDVPADVMEMLGRYVPDFEPGTIEMSERTAENWYEFSGTSGGTEFDIEVDAEARRILIQDDSAG